MMRMVSFNRLCVTLTQFIMGNHKVIKLIRSSERRFCTFFKNFFRIGFLQIKCIILKKTLELIELYVIIYISNVIFAL